MVPVNDKASVTEGCEGLVSVLMPAYRAARTIKAAVEVRIHVVARWVAQR